MRIVKTSLTAKLALVMYHVYFCAVVILLQGDLWLLNGRFQRVHWNTLDQFSSFLRVVDIHSDKCARYFWITCDRWHDRYYW